MTNYSKIRNNNHLYRKKNYNYRNGIANNEINFNRFNIISIQKNQLKNKYRNYKNDNTRTKCQTTYNNNIPQNTNFNKNYDKNYNNNIYRQMKRESLNKKNGRNKRSFNTPDIQIMTNNMTKYNLNSFENNFIFKNKYILNDSDIKSNDINIDSTNEDDNYDFPSRNFNNFFSRNNNNIINKNLFKKMLNIPLNRKRALTPDNSNNNILNINTINNKKIQKRQVRIEINDCNKNLDNTSNQFEKINYKKQLNIKKLDMNRNSSNFQKNNNADNYELKNSFINSHIPTKEKLRNINHQNLSKSCCNKTPSPLKKGKRDINRYFKLSKNEQTKHRNTKSYSQDNSFSRKVNSRSAIKNDINNLSRLTVKINNNIYNGKFSNSYNENCAKNNQQQNFNYVYHYSYNNTKNENIKMNLDYNSYIKSYQNVGMNKINPNNNSNFVNNSVMTNKTNTNHKNYSTKISTHNTFDDYNNSTCGNNNKFNKIDSIEEVHINFVSVIQGSKTLMKNQEDYGRDKIICNNPNSSVVILEERDIE